MEVLVGPTFGIEVAASASTYGRDRPQEKISSSCLFLKEDDVCGDDPTPGSDRGSLDVSSESSSSIGAPGESDEEEEEGVVSSGGSLGLAPIEDSLPINRGLSNHYAGKSKSFASLSDISSVKDLQKAENPFNKRRRVLLANKWHRKSSFYSSHNPNSMPLLALNEDDEDGEDKETPPSPNDKTSAATKPKLHQSKFKASFKSQSFYSLTDLQVQHE